MFSFENIYRAYKDCVKHKRNTLSFMNSVGKDGYYLQLDIKGFFYNLDKNILFKQLFNDINCHSELDSESILLKVT